MDISFKYDESNAQHVHTAVRAACEHLGVDVEMSIWAIHEYAVRNSWMHSDLEDLHKNGRFMDLAKLLWTDLCDLPFSFSSVKDTTDLENLTAIIKDTINRLFDVSDSEIDTMNAWPEIYQSWTVKPEVKAHIQKQLAEAAQPTKWEKNQAQLAEHKTKKEQSLAEEKKANEKKQQLKKREASTEKPRGSENESLRKKTRLQEINEWMERGKRVGLEWTLSKSYPDRSSEGKGKGK